MSTPTRLARAGNLRRIASANRFVGYGEGIGGVRGGVRRGDRQPPTAMLPAAYSERKAPACA